MNKHTAALASLITAATLSAGAAATAQAHPAQSLHLTQGHHASTVAGVRLHQMLHASHVSTSGRVVVPDDGGMPQH